MKEMNDEDLQRLFEDGKKHPVREPLSDDARVYQTLFEALNSEPENGLPYDFAAKVTRHIQAEQKRSNELKSNLIAAGLILAIMAILCWILGTITNTQSTLLDYKWILLLIPVAFIAIQYFDQKLVKTRLFDRGSN
ncbi:MAG TPA: hypothetical protein VHB54_02670 [Mucilaginibacter sp.]|nr:hypothetical protein [Mucilaginibacter sp.]